MGINYGCCQDRVKESQVDEDLIDLQPEKAKQLQSYTKEIKNQAQVLKDKQNELKKINGHIDSKIHL